MTEGSEEQKRVYSPVWISTFNHMKTAAEAMHRASFREKLRGDYDFPGDYPSLEISYIGPMRWLNILIVPLSVLLLISFYLANSIMFYPFLFFLVIIGIMALRNRNREKKPRIPVHFLSSGELLITDSEITFIAEPYNAAGLRYHNLSLDLQFKLQFADIKSIERFAPHKEFEGYGKSFSNEWVRVYTKEEVLEGDFLLVVGGSGFGIRSQRRQTDEIYTHLGDFVY
ncbi:MAG: hypothetical protein ACXADF_15185 [Candidatus Thorarchaeota archaeon]